MNPAPNPLKEELNITIDYYNKIFTVL